MNTLQIIASLISKEGWSSLYRGIKPVLASLGTSNFIYFYTFHGLKTLQKGSAHSDLLLGMIAGVVNVLATTPLWVVNSRLKISQPKYYSGLLDGIIHIANSEGLGALWAGVAPSLLLVVNPAIQFTVYEALKRNIKAKSTRMFFLMGALAKAIATIITYPLQLAQARLRHSGVKMSTAALLLAILKRNGPKALFQGLEAKLLQTVLTAALMFATYEKIVRFVFVLLLRKPKVLSRVN